MMGMKEGSYSFPSVRPFEQTRSQQALSQLAEQDALDEGEKWLQQKL